MSLYCRNVLLINRILIITTLLAISSFAAFPHSTVINTIDIEEVVVTSTKTEVARKYVPLPILRVTGEVFRQTSELSLLPLNKEGMPGLFVTERGISGFRCGNRCRRTTEHAGSWRHPNYPGTALFGGTYNVVVFLLLILSYHFQLECISLTES